MLKLIGSVVILGIALGWWTFGELEHVLFVHL